MPLSISSPIGQFHPGDSVSSSGQGDPNESVSVRLENVDQGNVWNPSTGEWERDPGQWVGGGLEDARLFSRPADFSRLASAQGWGGSGERVFSMEWRGTRGTAAIPATGTVEILTIGHGTKRYDFSPESVDYGSLADFALTDGRLELSFRDVSGTAARFIQSEPLVPAVEPGDQWGLRVTVDQSIPLTVGTPQESVLRSFEQLDETGQWVEVPYDRIGSSKTTNVPNGPIEWYETDIIGVSQIFSEGELGTSRSIDVSGFPLNKPLKAEVSHGRFAPPDLFYTKSLTISDLTSDVDAIHLDVGSIGTVNGENFSDPHGNEWNVGAGSQVQRTRAHNWSYAVGTESWSWIGPNTSQLDNDQYRIVAAQDGSQAERLFTLAFARPKPQDRFVRRGTAGVYWATQLADYLNPTSSELDVAVRLCDIADMSNATINHSAVEVRRATSPVAVGRPGRAGLRNPTLVMYDRLEDSSVRHLFETGSRGFLILAPHGLTKAGARIEVIPVVSAGNRDLWNTANEPARIEVSLVASEIPAVTKVV